MSLPSRSSRCMGYPQLVDCLIQCRNSILLQRYDATPSFVQRAVVSAARHSPRCVCSAPLASSTGNNQHTAQQNAHRATCAVYYHVDIVAHFCMLPLLRDRDRDSDSE
eukprot:TRINITY_DN103321_c0_g1_i1.p2 TRINITY_DN103321_c0_g1~~TRINITY_DN103321_c0_g1_i1.p2  ORF type:complete len:108 (-),score=0.82 TRINITY_DN103321_c0_g1_i1:75-398(-)